jgi:hypothetical protein
LHGVQFDAFLPALPLQPPQLSHLHFSFATTLANRLTSHSRFHDSRAPPHD